MGSIPTPGTNKQSEHALRLFQAIEAQYAAIHAIQNPRVGDALARIGALTIVWLDAGPLLMQQFADTGHQVLTAALVVIVVAYFALDRRRHRLVQGYWGASWAPPVRQRLLIVFVTLLIVAPVAITSKYNLPLAWCLFVVLGSLPLKDWVDRIAPRSAQGTQCL